MKVMSIQNGGRGKEGGGIFGGKFEYYDLFRNQERKKGRGLWSVKTYMFCVYESRMKGGMGELKRGGRRRAFIALCTTYFCYGRRG